MDIRARGPWKPKILQVFGGRSSELEFGKKCLQVTGHRLEEAINQSIQFERAVGVWRCPLEGDVGPTHRRVEIFVKGHADRTYARYAVGVRGVFGG